MFRDLFREVRIHSTRTAMPEELKSRHSGHWRALRVPELLTYRSDLSKATQNNEVLAFADHWRTVTGTDPALLIFDLQGDHPGAAGRTDRPRHHVRHPAGPHPQAHRRAARPAGRRLDPTDHRPVRRPYPPGPRHRRPEGDPVRLPRNAAPARRRRPGPRRTHRPDHERPGHPHQEGHRGLRPPDEHRTTLRRSDPRLQPRRPRRRPLPPTSSSPSCCPCWPTPSAPHLGDHFAVERIDPASDDAQQAGTGSSGRAAAGLPPDWNVAPTKTVYAVLERCRPD